MMKRIFAILTALCLLFGFALAEEGIAPSTVTAVGCVTVECDSLSVLTCTLASFAPTVAEAQALMQDQLYPLREVLREQGVAEGDIASTSYDVQARYEYHHTKLTEKKLLNGYDVTVTLESRVADTHDVGTLIDAINAAGITCEYDLQYETVCTPEARDAALVEAAQEAMRKAGLLAEAGQVKLFELISLEESIVESGAAVVRVTYTVK